MNVRQGTTCQITAYHVELPARGSTPASRKWMANATVHYIDLNARDPRVVPGLEPLVGLNMKTLRGNGFAGSEHDAMRVALGSVLEQLEYYTEAGEPDP